jgi:hypothetical protein
MSIAVQKVDLVEFNFQAGISLQGSEMFIDTALNPITRAPAERNVPDNGEIGPCFAPLERGKNPLGAARSINISPLPGRRHQCSVARLRCIRRRLPLRAIHQYPF